LKEWEVSGRRGFERGSGWGGEGRRERVQALAGASRDLALGFRGNEIRAGTKNSPRKDKAEEIPP
jgi:hypothetical protein